MQLREEELHVEPASGRVLDHRPHPPRVDLRSRHERVHPRREGAHGKAARKLSMLDEPSRVEPVEHAPTPPKSRHRSRVELDHAVHHARLEVLGRGKLERAHGRGREVRVVQGRARQDLNLSREPRSRTRPREIEPAERRAARRDSVREAVGLLRLDAPGTSLALLLRRRRHRHRVEPRCDER